MQLCSFVYSIAVGLDATLKVFLVLFANIMVVANVFPFSSRGYRNCSIF